MLKDSLSVTIEGLSTRIHYFFKEDLLCWITVTTRF